MEINDLNYSGLNISLYRCLWHKNHGRDKPYVNIPHSIVFRLGQPVAWYFSALDGRLLRKKADKLKIHKIFEEILRVYSQASGVSASVKRKIAKREVVAYFIGRSSDQEGSAVTTMEYFTTETLANFLFSRNNDADGILQAFVDPPGSHNSVLRVRYSKSLIFEKRTNVNLITDRRRPIAERMITFEGSNHHSTSSMLNSRMLRDRLESICNHIAAAITSTAPEQGITVHYLSLYFKLDDHDRIWFLWCSNCVATDKITPPPLESVDDKIILSPSMRDSGLIDRDIRSPRAFGTAGMKQKEFVCPDCCLTKSRDDRFEISIKAILEKAFEQQNQQKIDISLSSQRKYLNKFSTTDRLVDQMIYSSLAHTALQRYSTFWSQENNETDEKPKEKLCFGKQVLQQVPLVLQRVFPSMSTIRLASLCSRSSFLYDVVAMCEDCASQYITPQLLSECKLKLECLSIKAENIDLPTEVNLLHSRRPSKPSTSRSHAKSIRSRKILQGNQNQGNGLAPQSIKCGGKGPGEWELQNDAAAVGDHFESSEGHCNASKKTWQEKKNTKATTDLSREKAPSNPSTNTTRSISSMHTPEMRHVTKPGFAWNNSIDGLNSISSHNRPSSYPEHREMGGVMGETKISSIHQSPRPSTADSTFLKGSFSMGMHRLGSNTRKYVQAPQSSTQQNFAYHSMNASLPIQVDPLNQTLECGANPSQEQNFARAPNPPPLLLLRGEFTDLVSKIGISHSRHQINKSSSVQGPNVRHMIKKLKDSPYSTPKKSYRAKKAYLTQSENVNGEWEGCDLLECNRTNRESPETLGSMRDPLNFLAGQNWEENEISVLKAALSLDV